MHWSSRKAAARPFFPVSVPIYTHYIYIYMHIVYIKSHIDFTLCDVSHVSSCPACTTHVVTRVLVPIYVYNTPISAGPAAQYRQRAGYGERELIDENTFIRASR